MEDFGITFQYLPLVTFSQTEFEIMNDAIKKLLPQHKFDIERANAIVSCGDPAVETILPELVEWLRDYNWPVARVLSPFLANIGLPIVPAIHYVLQTDDDIWKYWVLLYIVDKSSLNVAENLRDELTRIATQPTRGEILEEANVIAQEILEKLTRVQL